MVSNAQAVPGPRGGTRRIFKSEREKLLDSYKMQLTEINSICDKVSAKAEEVQKAGARMEAKLTKWCVVLQLSWKISPGQKLNRGWRHWSSCLLQSSIRQEINSVGHPRKLNSLKEQMRLTPSAIRDVSSSLGLLSRLEASVLSLEEDSSTRNAKLTAIGGRLLKQERFASDFCAPEIEAGKAERKVTTDRLMALERWRLDTDAELDRVGASTMEISQKVKEGRRKSLILEASLVKENENSERKLHSVEMALQALQKTVKKDMSNVSSNVKQVLRMKMGNALTRLKSKKNLQRKRSQQNQNQKPKLSPYSKILLQ